MFSALFFGAFLLVTGSIGYDISHMGGLFRGGRWVDGPVWRQIALGGGLVLLGVYWARQLAGAGWTPIGPPRRRAMKYVGRGSTYDVDGRGERRLPSGAAKRSGDS